MSASTPFKGNPNAPIRFQDHLGRTIALSQPPKRIVSLSPAITEMLSAIGCGDRIVLRDRFSDYPPSIKRVPATHPFLLAVEHVAGFHPDMVFFSRVDTAKLRPLELLSIPTASLDPRTVEQVFDALRLLGKVCAQEQQASALVWTLTHRLNAIMQAVKGASPVLVYVEIDASNPARPWTAGPGSLVQDLVTLAGGTNVGTALGQMYAQLPSETIWKLDPDVILLMNVNENGAGEGSHGGAEPKQGHGIRLLHARPGWSRLQAVQKGRVIDWISRDILSRPGPRILDGLELLARAFHPVAFKK